MAHVLIVDDDELQRKLWETILKRIGHSAETAACVLDALETLCQSEKEFDLIITDLEMPVLDGEELIEKIRSGKLIGKQDLKDIPIILATGTLGEGEGGYDEILNVVRMSKVCDLNTKRKIIKESLQRK